MTIDAYRGICLIILQSIFRFHFLLCNGYLSYNGLTSIHLIYWWSGGGMCLIMVQCDPPITDRKLGGQSHPLQTLNRRGLQCTLGSRDHRVLFLPIKGQKESDSITESTKRFFLFFVLCSMSYTNRRIELTHSGLYPSLSLH